MTTIQAESTSNMFPRLLVALENELPTEQFYSQYKGHERIQLHHTGVGLVNACNQVAKLIYTRNATSVINFGTAGLVSNKDLAGKLVEVDVIIHRDMKTEPQAPRGVTPFEDDEFAGALTTGSETIITCGSGDSFVQEPDAWFEYANIDLVDMEAYAIAKLCAMNNIPFRCFKYVTDFADENAMKNWQANVADGAELFIDWINKEYDSRI